MPIAVKISAAETIEKAVTDPFLLRYLAKSLSSIVWPIVQTRFDLNTTPSKLSFGQPE